MTHQNALHLAIGSEGHLDVVKYLVEDQGFDIRSVCLDEEYNALHLAVSDNHWEIVEYLVQESGADPDVTTTRGFTALHIAIEDAADDALVVLLRLLRRRLQDQGLKTVEGRDLEGQTPLHHAVRLGRIAMVEALLDHGADPMTTDSCGSTALHHACDVTVAAILVEWCHEHLNGESPCNVMSRMLLARNITDHTPYAIAVDRLEDEEDETLKPGYQELVSFLASYVAPLAVPSQGEMSLSVKLNPDLTEKQNELSQKIYDTLVGKIGVLDNVAYHIMGYLCLSDVATNETS